VSARILQVITDDDRRGAQVFALDLEAALRGRDREVRTVALAPGSVGGLHVPVLGRRRIAVDTLCALRRELSGWEVVVAHGSSTLPACAIATAQSGVPFVYRQISDSRFWAPGGLRRLRVKAGLSRAAAVVALSSEAAETLGAHLGVAPARTRVIPNGVPPARYSQGQEEDAGMTRTAALGLDPSRTTVVYVGALAPEKGVDLAIAAMSELRSCQLLVVGDGPQRADLEAQARRVAPGRVVFTGTIPDPVLAYSAADVVVLPSRGGDSMPAVLIEAGMTGTPVVSTPVGAIPDIVRSGITGELVPIGDVPALARAIAAITESPERARAMGEAARDFCLANFGIDVVAQRWDELLQGVAAVAGRGRNASSS
jgi:glycosyltransferase involved in cell wall biosynthesis